MVMKNKKNLDQFKGENPFKVPEGYFENLTTQIMSQLPEQSEKKEPARTVTMMERVRPWLYMAAVFIGLLLFFKGITGFTGSGDDNMQGQESLLVHTEVSKDQLYDEDEEYLEYLENQYANYILAEEWAFSE